MAEVTSPPKKRRRSNETPQKEEEEDDEGFKFRRSRRAKTNYYQGKRSLSKSTKKKRRSSFVRGRKQRKSLAAPASQNSLYHNIPTGLPPTARLRILFNKSLELAITKITEQQSSIHKDYPDFQEEAKTVFEHLRQVISETDIIDEATAQDQNVVFLPNPSNQLLEEKAVSCGLVSERLEEEERKWDELLQSYQQLEEKTKQEYQEYVDSNKSKEEYPDFLSPSQHKLLSGKPGYKSILEKLENVKQHSQLQVDKVCQVNSSLKSHKDFSETYVQEQTKSFGAKSLKVISDMGTPRTLIRGHFTGH